MSRKVTHNIFVTVKQAKTKWYFKAFVLVGVGHMVWSEISRRKQEEKICQLVNRVNELEQGEGE